MGKKKQQSIQNQLKYIADNMKAVDQNDLPAIFKEITQYHFFQRKKESYIIPGEAYASLKDLIKELLEVDGWSDKFSETYLLERIKNILIMIVEDGNYRSISKYLSELQNEYEEFASVQTVYVPLMNISMETEEFEIGNIRIIRKNDLIKERLTNLILGSRDSSGAFEAQMNDVFKGTYSVFSVIAEPIRAAERAEEETRRAIEIFRLTTSAMSGHKNLFCYGIQGDMLGNYKTVLVKAEAGDAHSFQSNRKTPFAPFVVSEFTIGLMKELGFFEVSDIIKKGNNITDFEETLLRSIHWFATFQTQMENESRLLSLVTCLEAFLTPPDNEPIRAAVAEGTALTIKDTLEDRKRVKKAINDLYRKRSHVSHGRNYAVLDTEIQQLESIVLEFIWRMNKKVSIFKDRKSYLGWIEKIKLSGKEDKLEHND